jgi:hypothetical protein
MNYLLIDALMLAGIIALAAAATMGLVFWLVRRAEEEPRSPR